MAGFSIDFVSDVKYEYLTAEISFNGQRLCVLDKERGGADIDILFLADLYILPEKIEMKFGLDEFLKVIEDARSSLIGTP